MIYNKPKYIFASVNRAYHLLRLAKVRDSLSFHRAVLCNVYERRISAVFNAPRLHLGNVTYRRISCSSYGVSPPASELFATFCAATG